MAANNRVKIVRFRSLGPRYSLGPLPKRYVAKGIVEWMKDY